MNKYLLIGCLFCAPVSHAFSYLNWGVAVDYPASVSYSDVQTYSFGIQRPVSKTFDGFAEIGGWKDAGHYDGAKGGFFGAAGLALDLKMGPHYAVYSLGPAYIGPIDTLLGSPFEIYHKLSFGFRDGAKRIGAGIKHFSNAGLSQTNYGRNFVFVEVSF